MRTTNPTASALQHMADWTTTRGVATACRISIQAARNRAQRLLAEGLVEARLVDGNPQEFRRTEAGSAAMRDAAPPPPEPVAAPAERTGSNPFDWRNFRQPVLSSVEVNDYHHKPDTTGSKLRNYTI